MRVINYFSERPKEREVITVGNRASIYIRTNIEQHELEGEEPHTEWVAVEYSTTVNANGFKLTDAFVEKLIQYETDMAALNVRITRNALLDRSDKEMAVDRIESEDPQYVDAWKAYRQALRDITKQGGFPFNVEWPIEPKKA